ncbi:class I SAM-dependent methyltransferase [Sphingomonas bisphenolicum]|uniref:Methyltransferase n=1 Tax=Sphingomonas bisphenolicum TaxID=296544 RepID=A0ABN5WID1_9SPHN|nr:class I SAM-dependent methyltransferase [Sphingomonas bisphenolicum]BBF71978.1 methyltransferase [Sphingomonas bisphenolicum]
MTGADHIVEAFSSPEAVANYAHHPRLFLPGLEAVHRMTGALIAERAPENARILVLGAGGGLELKALADAYPGWTFVGVDPSAPMLALAESTLGLAMDRVELVTGYIDDAPAGPFDAATCLLTLHFLDAAERRRTNAEVHRRLRPGAPYVTVHCSFDQSPVGRALWLDRFAAQAVAAGADPDLAAYAREAVAQNSNLFDPETDERLLGEAGFADTSLFFTALTWRGWVSHA